MQYSIFDQFYKIGIIPVLEIDSLNHAVPLAESSIAGDLPIIGGAPLTQSLADQIGVDGFVPDANRAVFLV